MEEFPLILAGPIVRRVESKHVSIWVATKHHCEIELCLWQGLIDTGVNNDIYNQTPFKTAFAQTKKLGKHLFISVITLKLDDAHALTPGSNYSYNLIFDYQDGAVARRDDLKTLKLLEDTTINGKESLALGYTLNRLPSFATTPANLEDLNIISGSCRKANKPTDDGLTWVDDFINDSGLDPITRPHQMFLSGDQIYADDVDHVFLHHANQIGRRLMGVDEDGVPYERLPIWTKQLPAHLNNFPASFRLTLTYERAMFTSTDGANHLLSMGEFAATYLMVWSNVCWPVHQLEPSELLPCHWQNVMLQNYDNLTAEDTQARFPFGDNEKGNLLIRFHNGNINKENLQRLFEENPTDDSSVEEAFALLCQTSDSLEKDRLIANLDKAVSKTIEKYLKSIKVHGNLVKGLPKVRRALANIPTYMMFDDHEVTDDWYLNPLWREQVLNTSLGKTIIRNGLVSYLFFQGWGNDPDAFAKADSPNKELLDRSTQLFPVDNVGPDSLQASKIDELLGLNLKTPKVDWHYHVLGSKHKTLVLDNRTRRSFLSVIGPPENISSTSLKKQIPIAPLEPGLELLVIVAPMPLLAPPVIDELISPASYRIFDAKSYKKLNKKSNTKGMPGTDPDAIEGWANAPKIFEEFWQRVAPYKKVVILSGDIHHGASQAMSYWRKSDTKPARFAQFTSSGMKNEMPTFLRTIDRSLSVAQQFLRAGLGAERLGWKNADPTVLQFPEGTRPVIVLKSKLKQTPMLLPTHGWPPGTKVDLSKKPDWSWRVEAVLDKRPHEQRPLHTRPIALHDAPGDPDINNFDALGYQQVIKRQLAQLDKLNNSRQILFEKNLGRIRFQRRMIDDNPHLIAIQELHTTFPDGTGASPQAYTIHEIDLDRNDEPTPMLKFNEEADQVLVQEEAL